MKTTTSATTKIELPPMINTMAFKECSVLLEVWISEIVNVGVKVVEVVDVDNVTDVDVVEVVFTLVSEVVDEGVGVGVNVVMDIVEVVFPLLSEVVD